MIYGRPYPISRPFIWCWSSARWTYSLWRREFDDLIPLRQLKQFRVGIGAADIGQVDAVDCTLRKVFIKEARISENLAHHDLEIGREPLLCRRSHVGSGAWVTKQRRLPVAHGVQAIDGLRAESFEWTETP
jgi:hypothetical protein